MVVAELEHQDLQHASKIRCVDACEGIKESSECGRTVLPRMLIEAPTDSEEIEEVEAIRVCDCILHRPGSQMW